MKPYIISHMMESVDGRIDCAMTEQIAPSLHYYEALDELECPSQLMGRVTMQTHHAAEHPFVAKDSTLIGKTAIYKAVKSNGYTVGIDTKGRLQWPQTECDGAPLLVITSEACPKEYLDRLTEQGISWIAVGSKQIDLPKAMDMLYREFDIHRLAITGGGHINGAFLEAGLIDEISIMIGPGIDGRKGMPAVFDGIEDPNHAPTLLRLESMKKVGEGTVWLRYKIRI